MKQNFAKMHDFFKDAMPYMTFLVIILFLANFAKLREMQDDIANIQQDVENMKSDVSDLENKSRNQNFDNSDVISMIREHHRKISNQIDEAERQIKANTVIWSR